MNPADVLEQLARFARGHPGEAAAVARFRALLEDTPAPFSRAQFQPGHLTCSACVLGAGGERVLLLHHAKLSRWLQPGGHVEAGDAGPLASALREVREESGIAGPLRPLEGGAGGALVDLDVHEIPARGDEPAHLHYDLRYALAVPGTPALRRSGESNALRWVEVACLEDLTREESVTRLVARARARVRVEAG